MLFSIDQDSGNRIIGWLMPNNPSVVPRIRVVAGGEVKGVFKATQYRPLLKEQGLHDTGVCGFALDEKLFKGLANAKDLAIFDEDTDLLIYRRRPVAKLVELKLFRIETRLLRLGALNKILESRFQMNYSGLELLPEETVISILAIPFTNSIYATGRVFVRAFEHQSRDRGFISAILIRDPFYELAERLLALKWVGGTQGAHVMPYIGKPGQAAARALRHVDLASVKSIEDCLIDLDREPAVVLINTLTRQLATKGSIDTLDKFSVSAALDTLSEIDVVGLSSDIENFTRLLDTVLKADEPIGPISLPVSPRVEDISVLLRNAARIGQLIGADIELYDAVVRAFAAVDRQETELRRPMTTGA